MLFLQKPSADLITGFLAEQAGLPFSYAAVGATAGTPPPDYVLDHRRTKLGEGEAVWRAARSALRRWEQFRLGWVEAGPPQTPIRVGSTIAVLARVYGVWWLNACRIVYVIDEDGPIARFGFAYGTLPGHVEKGEERFLLQWDRSDNAVWYDILAFSRPNHILTRLGYPLVRRRQKQFGRNSTAAMLGAVASARD